MFRFVVIVALLGVALGANIPAVPTTEWNGRIVGGQIAGADQFPYQASLRTPANFHFCGGSLITNRWVLSAAHCTIGRPANQVDAIVGTLSRIAGGIRYPIQRIINHEHYNANLISNDVCILQTESEIIQTPMVGFIALGQGIIGGQLSAVISGWGQTSHPGSAAATLMFLFKTTLSNDACRASHTANNAPFVLDSTLCAGGNSGQGICMGDSGGPLVVNNAVHGIASWVIPCGVGFPDAYARVGYFHPWITINMMS